MQSRPSLGFPARAGGKETLRILYLEDDVHDWALVAAALAADRLDGDFVYVKTQADFVAALQASRFDLILSDFSLPGFSGLEALALCSQSQPEIPFLFVSGTIGEERTVECLRSGATDCIFKHHLDRLPVAVRRALREAAAIQERQRAERCLAAFSKLGHRLSAARSVREAAEIIVDVADQLLGWHACSFDLYSPNADQVLHVLSFDIINDQRTECGPASNVALPSLLARRAIQSGGQLLLNTEPGELERLTQPFGDLSRASASLLLVPVRDDARVIGLLSVQSYTAEAYGPADLETLQALADHCGGALTRIQTESARVQLAQRMQLLLDSTDEGIYGIDLEGRCTFINRAGAHLIGWTREEVLGRNAHEVLHHHKPDGSPYPMEECPMSKAFKTGARCRLTDEVFWRRDGTSFPVEYSSYPIVEGEKITGAVVAFTDITGRKQLEDQLRQAQKMEAIGQLAGGVAHDFNNLLAVIRGSTELVLMDPDQLSSDAREYLKQVTTASDRAANLTRQLLAFSRKQVMQFQTLDLNEVIGNLAKMLRRIIGEDIRLQCAGAPRPAFIQADVGMLEQVLMNLVVNARDAMPEGGDLFIAADECRLEPEQARGHPDARVGNFVRLRVRDTGSGISPEHLARLFEPFFTTKAVGKGTGLGLATVYGIVKQHHGWIEVASEAGEGTTFDVLLPAMTSPGAHTDVATVETKLQSGTETILLVEDDQPLRSLTRRVLETMGYRILEADSGKTALGIWQQHAPEIQLLLTDLIMPDGVTGRELAKQLSAQKPELRVVFTSGYSSEAAGKDTELHHGAKQFFLPKPYTTHALVQTVRKCLDGE